MEKLILDIVSLTLEFNEACKNNEIHQSISVDLTRSTIYIGYVYHKPSKPIKHPMDSKVFFCDDALICEQLEAEKNTIARMIDELAEA